MPILNQSGDIYEERQVTRRLYLPELGQMEAGQVAALNSDELHYATSVLRLKDSETIELFDGNGHFAAGHILKSDKRNLFCELSEISFAAPLAAPILAVGYCKRFDEVLEKGTELGAGAIIPMNLDRTAISLNGAKSDHFTKVVLAAARQCRRYYLPEIWPITTLKELLMKIPRPAVALPHGAPMSALAEKPNCLLIGPEGGFSPAEIALFKQRALPAFGLGPHILRATTAAAASLAVYWQ